MWPNQSNISTDNFQIKLRPGSRCHRQKSLKDVRFAVNLSKSVRFAFNAMNVVKKLLSGENFFSALKRWQKIFHRYKQDAVKKKIFTATTRMRWKKFSPLPAECGEKKFFTAKIANLTKIYRSNFNAYLIFTGNIIEVSDRWRGGLQSSSHAWGRGSNPCTAVSFL